MFVNDKFAPVSEAVDLMLAEVDALMSGFLRFRIIHRFRIPATDCMPGEEVLAIILIHRRREYQLPLSPALLLLADYLLRHSRYAQTATQIATGIHAAAFYAEHAKNGQSRRTRRIPRSAVKVYIRRLHRALALMLEVAKVPIDPERVLTKQKAVSNHVLYQWKAIVDVIHCDSTAAKVQPIWGGNGRI